MGHVHLSILSYTQRRPWYASVLLRKGGSVAMALQEIRVAVDDDLLDGDVVLS